MSLRAFVLRRLMGRMRITDDVVRHLTTFQRLGETVEVELPGELMPIGARTVFRALRTRGAAQIGPDCRWCFASSRLMCAGSISSGCSTAISTQSNPQRENWRNSLVLRLVNGEVKRKVLSPKRMIVQCAW